MPEFLARVHEPPHGVRQHRVSAPDAGGVAAALGVPAMRLLSVHAVAGPAPAAAWRGGGAALSPRLFCQELAVLLDAGIPLLEALATLREKERAGPAAAVLQQLEEALRAGRALSDALRAQPRHFGPLLVAAVAASERSGQLAQALREHARYLAWAEGLRSKLVGAAIYPALLLGVGTLVTLFLLLYVLPRFAGVLAGLDGELPWASQALIGLGVWLAAHPLVVALVLGLVGVGGVLAWRLPAPRAAVAALAWHLPGLGARLHTLALARCYRTLGMLLAAGVPPVPALDLLRGVAGPRLAAPLEALRAGVASGQRLSDMLEQHGLATPVARRMVRVGERSGALAAMLEQAAAFHDEELARLSDFVTRAVNPVLMLLMGLVIGGIVVLMYLPIFTLVESVQ